MPGPIDCCRVRCRAARRIWEQKVCKPGGFCKRFFSARLWCLTFTTCLDKLVTRKTVTMFASFEAFTSLWAATYYIMFQEVASVVKVAGFTPNVYVLIVLCSFRFGWGLFGALAAWQRRVHRIRFYWIMVFANFVLFIPVVWPIVHMKCDCHTGHGNADAHELQCKATKSFGRLVQIAATSTCGAPLATIGRRLGEQSPLLVRRLATSTTSMPSEAGPRQDGRRKALDDLDNILQNYQVLAPGTELLSLNDDDALPLDGCGRTEVKARLPEPTASQFIEALRIQQCKPFLGEREETLTEEVAEIFLKVYQTCFREPFCQTVRWQVEAVEGPEGGVNYKACGLLRTAAPRLSEERIKAAAGCNLDPTGCSSGPNATACDRCTVKVPRPAPKACGNLTVYQMKTKTEKGLQDDLESLVVTYCIVINAFTVNCFLMITLAVPPMAIVIYKFIEQRAGEAFDVQTQFQIDFSEEDAVAADDDFSVGSWLSLEQRRGSRLELSTLKSGASMGLDGSSATSLEVGFPHVQSLSSLPTGDSRSIANSGTLNFDTRPPAVTFDSRAPDSYMDGSRPLGSIGSRAHQSPSRRTPFGNSRMRSRSF